MIKTLSGQCPMLAADDSVGCAHSELGLIVVDLVKLTSDRHPSFQVFDLDRMNDVVEEDDDALWEKTKKKAEKKEMNWREPDHLRSEGPLERKERKIVHSRQTPIGDTTKPVGRGGDNIEGLLG